MLNRTYKMGSTTTTTGVDMELTNNYSQLEVIIKVA